MTTEYDIVQIPINSNSLNYEFNSKINNTNYIFWLYYNRRADKWILNINDSRNNPIVMGIPLLIGSKMFTRFVNEDLVDIKYSFIYNKQSKYEEPGEDNLGTNILFFSAIPI